MPRSTDSAKLSRELGTESLKLVGGRIGNNDMVSIRIAAAFVRRPRVIDRYCASASETLSSNLRWATGRPTMTSSEMANLMVESGDEKVIAEAIYAQSPCGS
jgi:hypothetical protein